MLLSTVRRLQAPSWLKYLAETRRLLEIVKDIPNTTDQIFLSQEVRIPHRISLEGQ